MKIGPGFSLSIEDGDGQKALRFVAAEDAVLRDSATLLFEAEFDELCEMAGVGKEDCQRFEAIRERTIFSNGWQSWCFGGELAAEERVRRARIVPNVAVYCDGPGPREAADEVLSRFLTYVRVGDARLVLVSKGSPDKATPPVTFRVNRVSLGFRVELNAKGGRFAKEGLVAEIRLFYREGYFAAKDALGDAFRAFGRFERLDFLGSGDRLVPGGYESWYNHYARIDDGIIASDLASIGSNGNLINAYYLKRGKPTVFQIDDGWEKVVGDWVPNAVKFPRGMKVFAEEIEVAGMIPGIWVAPLVVTKGSSLFRDRASWLLRDDRGDPVPAGFNDKWNGIFYALDISLHEVQDHLDGIFARLVEEWGYRYLKLDFLYAAFLEGSRARPATLARGGAAYEHYDRLMRRLTSRVIGPRGGKIAYLGCGAPFESSFPYFPLMRIGADTKEKWEDEVLKRVVRHQGRPAAYTNLSHTIGRSLLDGTVFVNDPDVVFCRTAGMALSETEKELVALVDFMLASQLMFSDDAREFGAREEAEFTTRLLGLFDRLATREYGAERMARDVYGIFSRDGGVIGLVNLSGRSWVENSPKWKLEKAIVAHVRLDAAGLSFAPRSLSLFEA
jgi:alpha-galactosidase